MQVNTDNEGEKEFKFDHWIKDHKLTEIKQLLVKHKMTNISALNTSSTEFFKLMSDPSFISKAYILPSLMTAIQKIGAVNIRAKVIRIYISKEEEEATDKLNKYKAKILDYQQQIKISNDSLTKNIKACHTNIESSFNNLLQRIDSKKQEILSQLKSVEKAKKSQIYAQSNKINKEQQNIENALKKCSLLQDDVNMDRTKRKYKIIAAVDDIIKNVLCDDVANIDTKVTFLFDKHSVSHFIDSLAQIYDIVQHPIPLIEAVDCKSITSSNVSVHFTAMLSEKDQNRKVVSTLFMKLEASNNDINIDEKEEKNVEYSILKFDKNKKKYQFDLQSLTKNTNYTMFLNLYQSHNKTMRKMMKYKAKTVQFKTLSHNIDTRFVYESDFDSNGICYGVGSNYGKTEWSNPAKQWLIRLKSTGWNGGAIENVVGRSNVNSNTQSVKHAWISIDFGPKLKIKPSHYTLKHDDNRDHFLKTWNFEGSNDENNWKVLKKHENDTNLNKAFATHTWTIDTDEYFQMFRIYMVGENTSNNWHLLCSGFEIYGHLFGNNR